MEKSSVYIKMNSVEHLSDDDLVESSLAWVFTRIEAGEDENEALTRLKRLSSQARRSGFHILGETLIVGDLFRAQQFICSVIANFRLTDSIITDTIYSISDNCKSAVKMVDYLESEGARLIIPMFGQFRDISNSVAILSALHIGKEVDHTARTF